MTRCSPRTFSTDRLPLVVLACLTLLGLASCQQEMSRTEKGYSLPTFKSVVPAESKSSRAATSSKASGTSQNKGATTSNGVGR